MDASLVADGDSRWVISGTLDFTTVPWLWGELSGKLQGGDWVLDLRPVTRSNSAGLALLLEAEMLTRQRGGRLRIEGLPAGLAQLGRVSGLGFLLDEMTD